MEGTSSFAQVESAARRGWRASSIGALEGAAGAIPLSLGCATLLFSHVSPDVMASGLFATMLALACIHFATAGNQRPLMFTARIFEATTLGAMLDQAVAQLPAWGLVDSTGVRLAFLCAFSTAAGLFVCVLFLVRAERLTPFIPAPVFAGFSNSIAVVQLVSQSRSLWQQLAAAPVVMTVASTAAVALAGAYVLRRWRPRWPSAAVGLLLGLGAGLFWAHQGQPAPMVGGGGISFGLPVLQADFRALLAPEVRAWPMLLLVLGNGAILGTMIFINTAIGSQALTQIDGRRARSRGDGLAMGAVMSVAGLAGAAPISGSIMVSLAVARTSRVDVATMTMVAAITVLVFLTGVLGWVPLAAVVGVLLCDAWFLLDRPSLRLAGEWLRGTRLADNAREDLALIAAVTLLAVVANMVVAAFAGLVLGLFLFAVRSARKPVRNVWTGQQLSSNCARCSSELRLLAEHGAAIRVFELEGDMFFAVGASLEQSLHSGTEGATCLVLDWSRVRHVDTSVAITVSTFERNAAERGLAVFHAGAGMQHGNVAEELRRRMPQAKLAPDLDYALELAENRLIQWHSTGAGSDGTSSVFEAMLLFDGLNVEECAALERAMVHRFFRSGEVILAAGESSDDLMLILQGSASIVAPDSEGNAVRLAGVRRGAILGEVGFLDGSPRSANVTAQDDVMVAVLTREKYLELCRAGHTVVPKLLANVAMALASRLRHTNQLALARARAQQRPAVAAFPLRPSAPPPR